MAEQPTGPFELYDMVADRTETHDLAATYPDIADRLSVSWDDWKKRTHVRTWHDHRGYRPR